jgi:hypothetical protein
VRALILATVLLATSSIASAQTAAGASTPAAQNPEAPKRTRLMIGASLRSTSTPGIDTSSSLKPTFIWRWRGKGSRIDDRWAFAYRWSSYSSRVASQFGSQELTVADAKVRPLMIGADYKMPRGKMNWSVGLTAGWAFNKTTIPGEYRQQVFDRAGIDDLSVEMKDSLIWSPRVVGWYDLNRKVSFMVETAYLIARPDLIVHSRGVETRTRLNADALIVKAGFVYGIW